MSTGRATAVARAEDAIRSRRLIPTLSTEAVRGMAIAIVDTVYPEIREPKQMRGVPEGSILITNTRPNVTSYIWREGTLHELDAPKEPCDFYPALVIDDEGPLTVVWMP